MAWVHYLSIIHSFIHSFSMNTFSSNFLFVVIMKLFHFRGILLWGANFGEGTEAMVPGFHSQNKHKIWIPQGKFLIRCPLKKKGCCTKKSECFYVCLYYASILLICRSLLLQVMGPLSLSCNIVEYECKNVQLWWGSYNYRYLPFSNT